MARSYLWIVVLLLLASSALFAVYLFSAYTPQLEASDQFLGEAVRVEKAKLVKPGWVVVQAMDESLVLSTIGTTELLPAGEYSDFYIELSPPEPNDGFTLEEEDRVLISIWELAGKSEKGVFVQSETKRAADLMGRQVGRFIKLE